MSTTQPYSFSRPERVEDCYIAYCSLGGALSDPTRRGLQRQISYWLPKQQEWNEWVSQHESTQ